MKSIKLIAFTAIALGALGLSQANAQFANGDLVLFFRSSSALENDTLYVNLGDASTTFRGSALGPDVANLSLLNINADLTTAFGAGWASLSDLHMGMAAAENAIAGGDAVDNDSPRTIYLGARRNSAGTAGVQNSLGFTTFNSSTLGTIGNGIIGMNIPFTGDDLTTSIQDATTTSKIDNQNPIQTSPVYLQNPAFGSVASGIMQSEQAIKPASIGTIGTVANVEFALDLIRIKGITGGLGGTLGSQSFEGTVVLDNLGNVSFITVPEPTTVGLVGLGLAALVIARRRRKA